MPIPKILKDLLTLPTAPFVEQHVLRYIRQVCDALPGVKWSFDATGNLLAVYANDPPAESTPLAFVAHTDHPGFVALEMADRRTVRAAFRGGVRAEYFPKARVRFWQSGAWVRGAIVEVTKTKRITGVAGWTARPEEVLIRVPAPIEAGAPGMWDLPDPVLRGTLVAARGCDDLAGAAALLVLLQRLSRTRARGTVHCLFTRAEEVGFVGAIAAARDQTLPRGLPVISIETSSILPNAPQGAGPILRVGDRAAVFSPSLSAFCGRVAEDLAKRRKRFQFQRKLMDGGTCEAAPFLAYGWEAAGICVALGNYHNMDTERGRIAAETIHLGDWVGMVDWFEALVTDTRGRADDRLLLQQKMDERYATYERLLNETAPEMLRAPAAAPRPRVARGRAARALR